MKNRISKFIKGLAVLAITSTAAWGQNGTVAEGIVGVVGQRIILKSEVEAKYEAMSSQYAQQGITIEKCEVLEDLLMENLMLHHAEIDSVIVDESEVEQNIERRLNAIIAQFGGDINKLEQFYKKSRAEIREEMRPLIANQLTAQRMQFKITDDVEITPTEVQEFYNSFPTDSLPLINTEVELAQIVVYPAIDEEAEQEVVDRLTELKQRILDGRSFSTMAILYSEDPGSNKNGGEYTGIKRGQFVKEFEAVAFNLQPGEISDPFRTVYGYHIVQLQAKRGEELDLRHILIKPKISDANLNEASSILDSIRSKITSGELTFEEAVDQFSEDDETRYNNGVMMNPQTGDTKWDISNVDRSLFYAIQNLEAGDISEPVLWRDEEQKEAFRLVRVVNRTQPHRANMRDDYGRLKAIALQQKQGEAMREWVDSKINETFIRVNSEYYPCTFNHSWENDGAASSRR